LSTATPTTPPAEHPAGSVPLPHGLKQKIRDAILALSLANLCFLPAWFSQLADADFGYYNNMPITPPTLLALLANIVWLGLVIWLVLCVRRRYQNGLLHFLIHLGFFMLLLIPLDFVRGWIHLPDRVSVLLRQHPPLLFAAVVIVATLLWQHRRVAKLTAVIVGILSPLAFMTLAKIVLVCLGVIHLQQADFTTTFPPLSPVQTGRPRVIWIIFDEMDYRLAFEQRPVGVSMPAFDRLRAESLSATTAYPPADATVISMPGLISGQRIAQVGLTNSSDLAIVLADSGQYAYWSKLPSVFSATRELGFNTALVGWSIPYDRELGKYLNYCEWYPFPGFQPARAATFGAAIVRQISCMVPPLHMQYDYIQLYLNSMTASLSVVTNSSYGMILLHLLPPHPPGMYLPDKDRFTIWPIPKAKGYCNSLVLADRSLDKLRQALEASGEWDKTWLIVSADHSWRDSRAYDGQRDLRVPYLVKAPGSANGIEFATQFNTVVTHDLILTMLRGEITNGLDAASWLEAHQSKQLPSGRYNSGLGFF
jgi:hypothetical protein